MVDKNIVKITDTSHKNLRAKLVEFKDKIEQGVIDDEPYSDSRWDELCSLAHIEKQKQWYSKKGTFLPSMNIPVNTITAKKVVLGNGVWMDLESRLPFLPTKAFIDFGKHNNKFELYCYGKQDVVDLPIDTKVNRKGRRSAKKNSNGTSGTTDAYLGELINKGWDGKADAVIYWIRVLKKGVKYVYIGCTKLKGDELFKQGGRRRGHQHVVSKSNIGKLLAKANDDDIDYGVMRELRDVTSDVAYAIEGTEIDKLHEQAKASGGKIVRVNVTNNTKIFDDVKGSRDYNLVHGDIRAAKSRDTRLETKKMSDNYRKQVLDLILGKGMKPAAKGTTDWLIAHGYIHKTANRNMIYRWNKEFYGV